MASIEVRRKPGGWVDRARKYKVLVDGEEVGRVGAGEKVIAQVAAGEHEVWLKVDWCRSKSQVATLGDGDAVAYDCRPNANPLTVLWFISFGMGNYIALGPASAGELPDVEAPLIDPPPPPPTLPPV